MPDFFTKQDLGLLNANDNEVVVGKEYVSRRRNHHVKKLLTRLGGHRVPVDVQRKIKQAFSEFAEDIVVGED